MTQPVRILRIGREEKAPPCTTEGSPETVRADTLEVGLDRLECESFDTLCIDLADPTIIDALRTLYQAQHILAQVGDAVVVVDVGLRVRWANPTFQRWCGKPVVGQGFYEVLGAPKGPGDHCPFHAILARLTNSPGTELLSTSARLHTASRYIDLLVTPLRSDPEGPLLVALGHDVTNLVRKQQKLDALHRAGQELAGFDTQLLSQMTTEDRIELLKSNIRRLTRDLLQYEVIEIRLLSRSTGELTLLLQEGMGPDAQARPLYALPERNGVTGYVAATGRSYLCADTQVDPLYLPGAPGARSSLTVALRSGDRIVGTLNVENPRPGAFGQEDLQFAEIFSHAVAAALNTLELLSVEKTTGATQSIDAVNREVALPVDDILADATSLLERYVGHTPEVAERIRKILSNARQIKQSILQVGEDLGARPLPSAIREPSSPELRGLRVLVVDNDDRVRRSAHQLIGRWGGIVETARDGREALTMARLSSYDVIVADIRLPDLSGYEVYRGLKQARPGARVVLMTGYGYDPGHSLVKARTEGLQYVLFKPFRVDQLRDALTNLRQGSRGEGSPPSGKDNG